MDFIRTLYGLSPNDQELQDYILIWNKAVGSKWFKDIATAQQYALTIKNDVYFQVSLSHQDYGSHHRNSADEAKNKPISYLPALFADIDIKGVSSNGKRYPSNISECEKIYNIPGFEPTIVNSSGNGIHAFWCFDKPIHCNNRVEREQSADLLHRFKYMLQMHAAEYGFNVDSVQDLVRILRFPGTINTKNNQKRLCETLSITSNRYSKDYILSLLPAQLPLIQQTIRNELSTYQPNYRKFDFDCIDAEILEEEFKRIIFDPRALPPEDKLEILLINDNNFVCLYNHRPFPNQNDKSDSGYDFQLAKCCFYANWTMQEVANLLIAWRRKHSQNIAKALRKDYMYATLSRAKTEVIREMSFDFIDNVHSNKGTPYAINVDGDSEAKDKAKKSLSSLHGFNIQDIRSYRNDHDDARYEIVTDRGVINIPSANELLKPTQLKTHIARDIKVIFNYDKKKWDKSAQLMMDIVTECMVNSQALISTDMPYILYRFFKTASEIENIDDCSHQRMPFRFKGESYFFLERLIEYLRMEYASHVVSRDKILRALQACGCKSATLKLSDYIERVWKVPQELFDNINFGDY